MLYAPLISLLVGLMIADPTGKGTEPQILRFDSPKHAYRLKVECTRCFDEFMDCRSIQGTLYRLDPSSESYAPVWSAPLVNDSAPNSVYVSDDGRFVVTVDERGSPGVTKNAVVAYGKGGKLLFRRSVDELLPMDVVERFTRVHLHFRLSSTWGRLQGNRIKRR